jgi:hypothetical protein
VGRCHGLVCCCGSPCHNVPPLPSFAAGVRRRPPVAAARPQPLHAPLPPPFPAGQPAHPRPLPPLPPPARRTPTETSPPGT